MNAKITYQVDPVASGGKDVMLKRSWSVVSVNDVARLKTRHGHSFFSSSFLWVLNTSR
jgi:hypothetical protein